MAGLDDDTLIQLLQMTAESFELDPRKVEITDELENEVEAYESALRDALEEVAEGFPPGRDVTAEDLWDAEASYLVLMTLGGHGVGIWDGSWDDFFDEREIEEVTKLLKSRLGRFADETSGGTLDQAFMNAAYETAGEPEDEDEDEDEDEEDEEDEEEEDDEEGESDEDADYEENVKWSRAYKNRLPDSAFLYVDRECVDHKDEQGRSHPLDCRVFPYKNQAGNIDLSHLRNAIARIPVSDLPASLQRELQDKARDLLAKHGGYKRELARAELPMAANARRGPKYVYRVRGTAGAYKDRDRDLRHGMYTIYTDKPSEAEARTAAEQFMQAERPQGREARVWIEEHSPRTGDTYQVAKWYGDDRAKSWVQDYDRKP